MHSLVHSCLLPPNDILTFILTQVATHLLMCSFLWLFIIYTHACGHTCIPMREII